MSIFNEKSPYSPNSPCLTWRTEGPDFYSFYELGAGFLAQSLLTLELIIHDKNTDNEADRLIFPIMFSLWHGIELLLKSGLHICNDIRCEKCKDTNENCGESCKKYKKLPNTHELEELFNSFSEKLRELGLTAAISDLSQLQELIDDFKKHGVRFDAFRYPTDPKREPQFYNEPTKADTYIFLELLQVKIFLIVKTLPPIIKFIEDTLTGNGQSIIGLNDDKYNEYKKQVEHNNGKGTANVKDKFKSLMRFLRRL